MNNSGFVKGQKVISPAGEGMVAEISGDQITVKLETGETESFDESDLEDDSDAG